MTNSANFKCDSIKRCAVCKIDLKGRFVYIDDEVEKLLGFPREDLFGKPIHDFICSNSRQALEHLFSQRNNYETCYDTLNLNIKRRDKQSVRVSAVASLNLVSGNPVNYILIITSIDDDLGESAIASDSNENEDNLKALLQVGKSPDLKENLEYIYKFTNVKQICLYFINGEKLEPRFFFGQDNKELTFLDMPQPEQLHYQVAETGELYDFSESQAEESLKEYICRLNFSDTEKVLLRFIFDENNDPESNKESIERVKLSLLILERLYTIPTENQNKHNDNEINIRFVVGLLDSIDIGALLTDYNGNIIGFNGRLKDWLGLTEISGDIRDFFKFLNKDNDVGTETDLMDNFLNSFDAQHINKCRLHLPKGDMAMVTSLRLGETLDDLSSLVAFVPYYVNESIVVSSDNKFWIDSINVINRILLTSTKKNTIEFVEGIVKMLDAVKGSNKPQKVDLNVLVNDVFKQVKLSFAKKKIISRIESLPVLTIPEEKIRLVLEEIFKNSIEYNDNPQPAITVRSDIFAETFCLTIADNGCGMSDNDLATVDRITEQNRKIGNSKKYSSGLAKVKYILKSIDGRIDITSNKSEGTTVTISFPIIENTAELQTEPDKFLNEDSKILESSQIN